MRSAFLVVFLLLACFASGRSSATNPVLVLVQPGLPGLFDPEVDPDTFVHGTWIRWPEEALPPHGNRLLSVATGLPWEGEVRDFQFAGAKEGKWRSENFEALRKRGHLTAHDAQWGQGVVALQNMAGNARRDAMLLALSASSPFVKPIPIEGDWPSGKTLVIEARRGEEVARLSQLTSGRILVVEYPPRAGQNRSRFWMRGQGWPSGLPSEDRLRVPGLIRAESVATLLLRPERLRWQASSPTWSGANRWMDYAQGGRIWIMSALGLVTVVGIAAGAWVIGQEKRNAALALFMRGLVLVPAALVLGGTLARFAGLTGAIVWLIGSMAALAGLAALANLAMARGRWGTPIAGYGAVSFVVLLLADPRYSIWSGALGSIERDVPPEALGAMLAAFVLMLSSLANWSRPARFGVAFAVLALMAAGLMGPVWWKGTAFLPGVGIWLIPLAAWQGHKLTLFLAGIVEGILIAPQIRHGFAWLPGDLLRSADQALSVNGFEFVRFVTSPLLLVGFLLAGMFALFGAGFFNHQIRMAWREVAAARMALGVTGLLLVFGLAAPILLTAALFPAMAGVLALGEHLLRPLDV